MIRLLKAPYWRFAAAVMAVAALTAGILLAEAGAGSPNSQPLRQAAAGVGSGAAGVEAPAQAVARAYPPSSNPASQGDWATHGPDDSVSMITVSDPEFTSDIDCFQYQAWLSDELSGCLWHLNWSRSFNGELGPRPVGGDINIGNVWQITKGGNVNVAVVDDTWNPNHHDLVDNVDLAHSHNYAPYALPESDAAHASQVAGVIGARDNELGGRGIAPRATLFNYNLVMNSAWANQADAMRRNAGIVAVSNNSYSLSRLFPGFMLTHDSWWEAVDYGLEHGFGGLGTTYVFGAGNDKSKLDGSSRDVITNGYHAHPGVISACAVNNDGGETGYSQTGVALWICAPANDRDTESNRKIGNTILTTYGDNDYRGFGRTSAATAEISGVAALVRSANPYLSWRDVKLILAQTAQKNDPTHSDWSEGALHYGSTTRRFSFNPNYGFGVVNASAAVNAALTWKRLPDLVSSVVKSDGPEYHHYHTWDYPDEWDARIYSDGVTTELTLQGPSDIDFIEHAGVSLYLSSSHGRDLRIELVSPGGTTSMLVDAIESRAHCGNAGWKLHNFCNLSFKQLKLASSEFVGEDPDGTWTLRITDPLTHAGDGFSRTTLYSWQLRLLGHQGASSDTTPRARLRVNNANDISVNVNEGSTARVTASLTGGTLPHDVVIPVSVDPGTATQADYSGNGTLPVRIRAGQSSGSATFQITWDVLSEYDETFTVRWPDPHGSSAPDSVLLLGDPIEVTINGNLPLPGPPRTVTLEATPSTVVEGNAVNITATITRGGPWTQGISLPVVLGGGTATGPGPNVGRDYELLQKDGDIHTSIRIPAGQTSVTYQLETKEDDNWEGIEPPETVSVVVHRPSSLAGQVALVGSPLNITIVETGGVVAPVVSVSGGSPVDEGEDAEFTLRATPAPAAPLTVSVRIGGTGGFATAATRTVTIPASGSATLSVPTIDDSTDEPDGSVTVSVRAGSGYNVSPSLGSASVTVRDDDATTVIPPANDCTESLTANGTVSGSWAPDCQSSESRRGYARYYTFTLAAASDVTIDLRSTVDPYLFLRAGEAQSGSALHHNDDVVPGSNRNSRIRANLSAGTYTIEATTYAPNRTGAFTLEIAGLGATAPPPQATPVISITAGSDITEGGSAIFTLTANPRPASRLPVTVAVSQNGDYGVTAGSRTVYIPVSGSATMSVATTGDSDDERHGTVTVEVLPASGYDISASQGSATVLVLDDDDAPVIDPPVNDCVTGLSRDGSFSGTWASDCESEVRDGRYARYYTFTLGQQSWVTIYLESTLDTYLYLRQGDGATSGSPLRHNDDGGRGTDSRIADTLAAGTYTIEATTFSSGRTGSFILEVNGLDTSLLPPPRPEVSITAGSGVTEGGNATFTVTASHAPSTALSVNVTVSQSGDYVATGPRTVTIPPQSISGTLRVPTINDSTDEPDGSVTVAVSSGSGYDISTSQGSATVTVQDDDDAPVVTQHANNCVTGLSRDGSFSGTWDSSCESEARDGSYARFYTFTLAASSGVTINLESGEDTYLYVRRGDGATSGAQLHHDDDGGRGTDSLISKTFAAGTYTIEATTFARATTGSFTLTISGLDTSQPPACTPQLPSDAVTVPEVTGWRDAFPNNTERVRRWNRVLAALGENTGETPMTIAESQANEVTFGSRWDRVTRTLQALAQCG